MEYGFHGFFSARKICWRKNIRKALTHKGFGNFINRLSERLGKTARTVWREGRLVAFSTPITVVVLPIRFTTTSRLSKGRPRQFWVIWQNACRTTWTGSGTAGLWRHHLFYINRLSERLAVFPHTAFQSIISSSGLTSHSMSFFHSEKPILGEIRIWHKLM